MGHIWLVMEQDSGVNPALCSKIFNRFNKKCDNKSSAVAEMGDRGHNRHRPKRGGRCAGFPPNTMWPGLRPTCMPSFILIHPTVWPQCTNVIDRQDRTGQDRQTTDR